MTDSRRIVLLRGINLASRNRVSMPALRELLEGLGHADVRTHLQSGNVVMTSRKSPARLQKEVERALADELGVESRVVVRTRNELADVVRRDPFGSVAKEPKWYQVTFLAAKPKAAVTRELAKADVAPEQVVVSGREIYAWHPSGLQRSKLARLLTDEQLGVVATARNWNTVTKLLELADG